MTRSPDPDDPDSDSDSDSAGSSTVPIYVLKDGSRLGPFTEEELLEMVDEGTLHYEDVCLRAGRIETERLHQVLDWEEDRDFALGPVAEETEPPAETLDEFTEEKDPDDETWEEETDDDLAEEEEFEIEQEPEFPEEEASELPRRTRRPADPPTNPNLVLYAGHPSVLSFPKTLAFIAIAIAIGAGIYGRTHHPAFLLAGLVAALFGVSWILLQRAMQLYLITPKRVEIVTGLIAKNSNEVRIDDIRTINVLTPGVRGLLGVGTVEFASAGGSAVEVAFANVQAAHRIKGLVRRLQDAQGED